MVREEKDRGYKVAVSGAKGMIRLLLYILLAVLILFFARMAYSITYSIFHQEAMESGEGRAVSFLVEDGQTNKDIAKSLEKNGLIRSSFTFRLQEKFTGYEGKVKVGNYILNTNMTVDEILAVLSQEDTKGQPEQEQKQE